MYNKKKELFFYGKRKSIKYFVLYLCQCVCQLIRIFYLFNLIFSCWRRILSLSRSTMEFLNFTCHRKKVRENIWNHVFNDGKWKGAHTHFSLYYLLSILFALTGKYKYFFSFAGNTQKHIIEINGKRKQAHAAISAKRKYCNVLTLVEHKIQIWK